MITVTEISTTPAGYRPTLEERETIIRFDETQEAAVVFTYNSALIRKLDELTEQRSDEVVCLRAESLNGVQLREYRLPKKWVKVNPTKQLSEEQRQQLAERMHRINSESR